MSFEVIEVLLYKYVFENSGVEKKQARLTLLVILFIYGSIGTLCLIVITSLGHGLYDMCLTSIILVILAGIFLHTGITLYVMSIAIGHAGLTASLYNSYAGIHAAISYFVLR